MKVVHFRMRHPNFGDDLNPWMWPQLLPGLVDDDEAVRLLGVGSILSPRFNGGGRKVVCGTGFVSEYAWLPDLRHGDWRFDWVRGPRTASALGLDPALGLGDAAILLRALVPHDGPQGDAIAFMPHWESMDWGYWAQACDVAGITLIDPRAPVPVVLDAIRGARLVLCEAMHGAIVADALRVPWIALRPVARRNRAKWYDWSESLGLDLQPHVLPATSPTEVLAGATQRLPLIEKARSMTDAAAFAPVRMIGIRLAAARLRHIAKGAGQLSDGGRIAAATDAMLAALERLKIDWHAGRLS